MSNVKGTKTEQNIMTAFSGESQARNKYTYFALIAEKESNTRTKELFEKMAENEKQHAKLWFSLMNVSGDSAQNLMTAVAGENYEYTDMYKNFAATARAEGLEDVATMFDHVAAIERDHERRFLTELATLVGEQGKADAIEVPEPAQEGPVWHCPLCGYNHVGTSEAPYACPVCGALGTFVKE